MKDWKKEAEKFAKNKFDIILSRYDGENFIEFQGSIGGDLLTYRYYADGRITER